MIIQHDGSAWRGDQGLVQRAFREFLSLFVKPAFWQTRVTHAGFAIERLWRSPVSIPWSRIRCLDLSGLEARERALAYFPELSRSQQERFLRRRSLMIRTDHELVRAACYDAFAKSEYGAIDVLILQHIAADAAAHVRDELTALAKAHAVKLDGIWLPDP